MSESVLIAHCGAAKITRDQLAVLPIPESTATFKPIPHLEVVNALIETLGFRHIGVVRDEYAVDRCRWRRKRVPLWRVRRWQRCGYAMDSGPHHPGRWLVLFPCGNFCCPSATPRSVAQTRG